MGVVFGSYSCRDGGCAHDVQPALRAIYREAFLLNNPNPSMSLSALSALGAELLEHPVPHISAAHQPDGELGKKQIFR